MTPTSRISISSPLDRLLRKHCGALWNAVLRWLSLAALAPSGAAAEAVPRIPSHLEFVSQWFPEAAATATHCDVEREGELASRLSDTPAHFQMNLEVLDLIRANAGFDHSQIERFTTATISAKPAGTIVFLTLNEVIPPAEHFASGQFPIQPEIHGFHNLKVYRLPSAARPLGLYSADGKHFILGDWEPFKQTLVGDVGQVSELAKILTTNAAPIILCSNPRRVSKRFAVDDPFGTVVSIDFQAGALALMRQEELPTPDAAAERLGLIEKQMPAVFEASYGLRTKDGARYLFNADGRHVTAGVQAGVAQCGPLLQRFLGPASPSDPRAFADRIASDSIALYHAAQTAGAPTKPLGSPDAIVASLVVGLEAGAGQRFQLPFLTGIEQENVARRLVFESGKLSPAPQVEIEVAKRADMPPDERAVRRHAREIATLTMSAAAAGSPQLAKLSSKEAIVETLCTSGLAGGPAFPEEKFKGPDLSPSERKRVTAFLEPSNGYLVYKPE